MKRKSLFGLRDPEWTDWAEPEGGTELIIHTPLGIIQIVEALGGWKACSLAGGWELHRKGDLASVARKVLKRARRDIAATLKAIDSAEAELP